jgi:hypothetical protein
LWFAVDGERAEVPGWHWYPHRWAGGAFTADYGLLRRLVPSPVHPVRVSRNRGLVCVWGAHVSAAGGKPPFFGFGEVAVDVFVTCGLRPAPPIVPGLGRRAGQHYGFGVYPLMKAVTNRVAAELYRILLGVPAAVADVRIEQRLDHERFVCEVDGRPVVDLTVRSDGRPGAGDQGAQSWFYTVEGGEVYRLAIGESGISRSRFGRTAASLGVGDHRLADVVRRLGATRPWAAEFSPDRHLWLAGAPERLGRDGRESEPTTLPDVARAQLMLSPTTGVEFEIDQGLAGLDWDPEGVFTGPTLHARSVGTRQSGDAGGKMGEFPGRRSVSSRRRRPVR